jgi:Ni/Fe-hydrogenase subunit HybB-like protein
LFAAVAAIFRIWFGLGATTHLSDAFPWGLWKILNMVGGVALSTGGFTVGFLVYVLKIDRYKPLVKPAILIAFLGYGSSCIALLFDIGLPHRFWHPILMWNETSFLFEVFWCVLLYFTVTVIETSPTILERWGFRELRRFLHRIAPFVVFVGISLSSLHHSSLGSLFLVTPHRLYPLWYSSLLPIFFFTSAVGGGLMVVVLARLLYARWYDPEPIYGSTRASQPHLCALNQQTVSGEAKLRPGKELPRLTGLASISGIVLGIYLLIKIIDLIFNRKIAILLSWTWESWLFVGELLIATFIPIVIVAIPTTRNSPKWLGIAAWSAAAGLALNRLNVGIFGYFRDAGAVYFPSLLEWALSLGVVAGGVLLFMFCTENFAFFEEGWKAHGEPISIRGSMLANPLRLPQITLGNRLDRVTLIAVFTITLAWITLYPPYTQGRGQLRAVEASLGLDTLRSTLRIDGNRSGISTDFPHTDHQHRLGQESSCTECHHISLPKDNSTPCSRCHRKMLDDTLIFDHFRHMDAVAAQEELSGWFPENHSCSVCHSEGEVKSRTSSKACFECHDQNMSIDRHPKKEQNFQSAPSFQTAMHETCITCHEAEAARVKKPHLADCSTCHQSIRSRELLLAARAVPGR